MIKKSKGKFKTGNEHIGFIFHTDNKKENYPYITFPTMKDAKRKGYFIDK